MAELTVGLWNVENPQQHPRAPRRRQRFAAITAYLRAHACDLYILTEGNAALTLEGYQPLFSAESPYTGKRQYTVPPNRYHQAALYSRLPVTPLPVTEPVNGVLGRVWGDGRALLVYGNVITIKDQWQMESRLNYSDRLAQQLAQFRRLVGDTFLIAGDFNLRRGWPQKKGAYRQVAAFVAAHDLVWPTAERTDTVQHLIHSPDLQARVNVDFSVKHSPGKRDRLSDHPFLRMTLQPAG